MRVTEGLNKGVQGVGKRVQELMEKFKRWNFGSLPLKWWENGQKTVNKLKGWGKNVQGVRKYSGTETNSL